jgi:predicted DsbA family dithiol-disulfide isomerase
MLLKASLIICFTVTGFDANAQIKKIKTETPDQFNLLDTTQQKMKIEIWSDIMCPFCYIGKRKFEAALSQFEGRDDVEIEWKSYQLSPDMVTDPTKNINQYLSEHKGISLQEAARMNAYVTDMAAKEGLTYNFDKTIVANSFKAHCFAHFAKQHGKQDEAEEKLFSAYFTEGLNLDDDAVLLKLGEDIGLDTTALSAALDSGMYADEVRADVTEAEQLGVRGVPFFVFDRKYAVSGAQDVKVFLQTLEKADHERENVSLLRPTKE